MFRRRLSACAAATALALIAVSPAMGQRFGRGFGATPGYQPDFVRRDLTLFVTDLQLDRDQRAILELIFEDYEAEIQSTIGAFRERQSALRPETELSREDADRREQLQIQLRQLEEQANQMTRSAGGDVSQIQQLVETRMRELRSQLRRLRPPRLDGDERRDYMTALAALGREWQAERRELREEFVLNTLAILTEEQVDRWPPLERRIRRANALGRGELSGEDVDLFVIVRELNVDAEAEADLEPILDAYDLELDAAIVRRDGELERTRADLSVALADGALDTAIRILDQQMELRRVVRSVNDRYTELAAASLPEQTAEQLREQFRMRGYARIFRPTRAQRAFDAAVKLEGLEAEILDAILELQAAYLVELGIFNEHLLEVLRREEPKRATRRMEWMAARRAGQQVDRGADPLRAEFERRDELGDRYLEQLRALLTPERYEALGIPERREEDRRGFGRGRGGWSRDHFGNLSEEERAELRAEFMGRFDTNGDGEIDAAEREAIREAFRSGEGFRGMGRGPRGPGGDRGGGG